MRELKSVVGCFDPNLGRQRGEQNTLRARYGVDVARNAMHCTDVPEESVLESEFFFVLLQERKFQQDQYHLGFGK